MLVIRQRLQVLLASGIALALCACAQNMRTQPSAAEMESFAVEAGQEYVIGPRDILRLNVWRQPELSIAEAEVRLDGKISVPLLDDVQAAGLTPNELKAVVTERLEEYVTEPEVTVVVAQSRSKLFYILGEVAREGTYGLQPDMRVSDAIAIAGGFNPFSGTDRVKLIRSKPSGDTVEFIFDYDAFVKGENLEQNVLLLPGDRIIVPEQSPFWR